MINLDDKIKVLKSKQNECLEERSIIKDKIKKLKDSFDNEVLCDINEINDVVPIVNKYGYDKFIISRYTKEELIKILSNITGGRFLMNREVKKLLRNVNMNGKKFDDVSSYKDLLNCLCDLEHNFSNINIGKRSKNNIIKREYNSPHNALKAIIVSYYDNLIKTLEKLYKKLFTISNKYESMIKIIERLKTLDVETNFEEYKLLVSDYSKILRNDPILCFDETNEVNNYIRKHVKEIERKKIVLKTEESYKYGTKEERKKTHERNGLETELALLKSRMDYETKLWLNMVIEQITNLDNELIKETKNNPTSFLPDIDDVGSYNFNLIVNAVINELRFSDEDKYKDIIESLLTLKK